MTSLSTAGRDRGDGGTVVVSPSIRIGLLRACAWLEDRRDEERAEAEAGVVNIRTGHPVIAGCYPVAVPLYIVADDLKAPHADLLLAATELVKLGHLTGLPDRPLVISHGVRISEAGRAWLKALDARRPAEAALPHSPEIPTEDNNAND